MPASFDSRQGLTRFSYFIFCIGRRRDASAESVASRRRPALGRRAVAGAATLLAVAGLLASCGSDDDAPAEAPATTAAADVATDDAPEADATDVATDDAPEADATDVAPSEPDGAPAEVPETTEEAEAAPSEEPSSQPERGGTLTFGTYGAPPSLNPGIGDPAYSSFYHWAYDSLLILQPDGVFAPNLAMDFGYTDDKNMRYELTLREGVKFSDGTDLDAEAVKAHLDYVRSQPSALAQLLTRVANIEATGPLSLLIELSESDPGLNFAFAQGFGVGNVISPAALSSPETLDLGTAGAGPYMLVPDESIPFDTYIFVPNPHYWNPGRVHWDEVVVRVIPNSSSMIEAMRAGQVHAAHGDATTMAAAADAGLTVISAPQLMVGINLMDRGGTLSAPLADVRVRQALNHGVDREAIAAALLGDGELALSQYALEGHKGYDPALDAVNAYDPDLARQLLEEAGYGDGVTIPVLDVSLLGMDIMVQAVAGQLAEVGVTLDITTVADVTAYFTGMVSQQHPVAAIGYGLANMQTLSVGFINPMAPFNPFGTVDEELDSLYAEYFATVGDTSDVEQRINARLVDQAWALPVLGAPLSWYLAEGLTGIEATPGNGSVPPLVDIRPA